MRYSDSLASRLMHSAQKAQDNFICFLRKFYLWPQNAGIVRLFRNRISRFPLPEWVKKAPTLARHNKSVGGLHDFCELAYEFLRAVCQTLDALANRKNRGVKVFVDLWGEKK